MIVSKLILITGEREFHLSHNVHLSARPLLKRLRKGEKFTFTRGFGHVSEEAFSMCGNPNKVFSTDNSPQLTFRFTWPA